MTETFAAHEYTKYGNQQSAIDPGKKHLVELAILCPKCKKEHPPMEHGQKIHCECGLRMQLWGNALECEL